MPQLTYPKPVVDIAGLSRAEWLAVRNEGIGGSDAAAILGVSPWTSRYSLWLDKTTAPAQKQVKPETEAMRFGNLMEPVVAEIFGKNMNVEVIKDTTLYRHPEHEFMLANLDGLISTQNNGEPDAVLEIKTSRSAWDEVPAYYVSQVQHYMAVTNMPVAYVAALFGGEEFATFEVPRDDEYIERLIEAEAEFWQSVQQAIEPAIDGSKSTHDTLRKAYDVDAGKTVELDNTIAEMIEWRANAKLLVEQYEAEVREAEARIMDALRDAEVGTINGKNVVTWKSQSRSSIDTKALKEAHPDIAEQFMKSSSFRVLRVK